MQSSITRMITRVSRVNNRKPSSAEEWSFRMTITFNRPYDASKDILSFIFFADIQNPAKNMRVEFDLGDIGKLDRYKSNKTWGACLHNDKTRADLREQISVLVYIPGTAVVAEWEMRIKTTLVHADYVWIYPKPIYLFTRCIQDDRVHFLEDKSLLNEYIVNEEGNVFVGNEHQISSYSWFYGQERADYVQHQNNDDDGVLVGNWTRDYSGGVSPTTWRDSVSILRQYYTTKQPVRFGQCWVFAQVLTTVCRALGIACRSLTNFNSAHDTDNTCTIDRYYDEEGNRLRDFSEDDNWNFHCWNDVWILRPDLPPGYDGWHALDSTPQERSLGSVQCGPCPVAAVRRGDIDIGYDTAFVFAEVNAEEVNWLVKDGGQKFIPSSVNSKSIGVKISTKKPTGTALRNLSGHESDDSFVRLDITDEYKPKEGSEDERRCVERALRFMRFGEELFKTQPELKVGFMKREEPFFVGQDIVASFVVINISKDDRRVSVTLTARHTEYWDRSLSDDNIAKQKFNECVMRAGQSLVFDLQIPYKTYIKENKKWLSLFVYGCAVDLNDDMPYSAQRPHTVSLPELTVKGPASIKSGQAVEVNVSFVNPLPDRPLTVCKFIMAGNLELADKKDKRFIWRNNMMSAKVKDVKPGKIFSISFKLTGTTTVADKTKSMKFDFKSKELRDLNGDYVPEIIP
ncbi:hypothetical protein C0Q70_19149 [Pomacea canaliculata]|uniref:Transglutaminase-like domain-containing protein n=1 Tax=Pomacea canaliculata TaxID=400727 RepID=A0A2T7NIJ9_POMCA|nr:hypothetical protein C0Q70_19149 [Pomacea canaliculata]